MWDVINLEHNFAGCRKFMAEEACLPFILPYLWELRRSGNALNKLLAAFQFVGCLGRRQEVEVRQNAEVREKAVRDGTSESWHGNLWKRLLYNFCISS